MKQQGAVMQSRNLFSTLALVAVLLAACAPQAIQSPAPAANPPQATEAPAQTQAPAAVATSRGDKLEATDPATVALASGGIQLVEFFRFT
jgi:uncharacterized lipoprotein YbaY